MRRNSLEITAEILQIAKEGAKKTHVVYGANLNFRLLEQYLEDLESQGLVTKHVERRGLIKTTEKGIRFLKHYKEFRQFLAEGKTITRLRE